MQSCSFVPKIFQSGLSKQIKVRPTITKRQDYNPKQLTESVKSVTNCDIDNIDAIFFIISQMGLRNVCVTWVTRKEFVLQANKPSSHLNRTTPSVSVLQQKSLLKLSFQS